MAEHSDPRGLRLVEGGLAALAICECIMKLQRAQQQPGLSPDFARLTRETLATLSRLTRSPHLVLSALAVGSVPPAGMPGQGEDGKDAADRGIADALRDAAGLFLGNDWLLHPGGKCWSS